MEFWLYVLSSEGEQVERAGQISLREAFLEIATAPLIGQTKSCSCTCVATSE